MINIKLDKKNRIGADRIQYILYRLSGDTWVVDGYFGELSQLLKYYIESNKRLSNAKTIEELIKVQNSLLQKLKKLSGAFSLEVIPTKDNELEGFEE